MILITTQCFPPDRGGIENLMGGLADTLHGVGESVTVFADGGRDTVLDAPYAVKRFGGLKFLRRRQKAWAVRDAAKAPGVTGVFADSWKSVELLPKLEVPIAVLAHGMEFPARPSAGKRARIAAAFAKAKTVIANSAYTAALAQPYVGAGTRLIVINPPIAPMDNAPDDVTATLRTAIAGRSPMLLTLARLEPRKGVDMVIRALPSILVQHPRAVYLVAGDGGDRPRLEALARETGVQDAVQFLGSVQGSAKAALYASADAFVMPARREGDSVEGFGIVYLEAAWYGTPSIAGREGGSVDAVRDGETGLLCDPTSVEDVAAQVLRLLGDEALRKRLGTAAAARAHGPLQWRSAISRYLDALI